MLTEAEHFRNIHGKAPDIKISGESISDIVKSSTDYISKKFDELS